MKQKGFTLIELLVVVAIIGILAAVGVVAYNGYTNSAKVSVSKSNHNTAVKKLNLKHIANFKKVKELNGKWMPKGKGVITDAVLTTKQKYKDIKTTTKYSKEGIQYKVTPKVTEEVIGEKTISSDIIPYMLSLIHI